MYHPSGCSDIPLPPRSAETLDEWQDTYSSPITTPVSSGDYNNVDFRRQNIIVFDWDDTLLCSSAINSSSWTMTQLQELEQAAFSALHEAMRFGEVMVITNGNATWVQESSKKFMPGLLPILEKITVVSARKMYETSYPGDPFMWKQAAFRQLLIHERPGAFDSDCSLNLVALGDQLPEIEAAHTVGKHLGPNTWVKTVKLKEAPSVYDIIGQLAKIEEMMAGLVNEPRSSFRSLARRTALRDHDKNSAHSSSWRSSTQEAPSYSFSSGLAFKDLWPLLP